MAGMRIGLVAATMLMAGAAQATVSIVPVRSEGSGTDAFNGASVSGTSGILNGFSAVDAFGAVTSSSPYAESLAGGHVIFNNDPSTAYIDFTPTGAPTIDGATIYLANDGNTTFRGFGLVALYGTNDGLSFTLLESTALNANYTTYGGDGGLRLAFRFDPVSFASYRFVGGIVNGGGRILEIDAGAVPEPASWVLLIGGFGVAGTVLRRRRALATA